VPEQFPDMMAAGAFGLSLVVEQIADLAHFMVEGLEGRIAFEEGVDGPALSGPAEAGCRRATHPPAHAGLAPNQRLRETTVQVRLHDFRLILPDIKEQKFCIFTLFESSLAATFVWSEFVKLNSMNSH
jgi:hypothetical protein